MMKMEKLLFSDWKVFVYKFSNTKVFQILEGIYLFTCFKVIYNEYRKCQTMI